MRAETNGLGIAGFVISLVGLCVGGLLSPVGLVLSLIALGKQPRGFAVAGVIIGAIGSCGIIFALVALPLALAVIIGIAAAVGLTAIAGPQAEAYVEMFVVATNIEESAQRAAGTLPATIAEGAPKLNTSQVTDPWGHPYVYELTQEGHTFRLYSKGPDGIAATPDDVRYTWRVEFNGQPSRVDPTPPPGAAPPTEAPTSETPAEPPPSEPTAPPAGT
ncbi:MAG: type II secretion system protein GspG [Phycisphaerae bacterium]|nr:type II secretion system protein GspG [Phycisphaerae bacterium]